MDAIALHYLDTAAAVATGVTWGVCLPRGELARGQPVHLATAGGAALPTQCWPLAYWPDGSVKWLGCACVLGPQDGTQFLLRPGAGPAPAAPVTVEQPGIEVFKRVDTGAARWDVGDRGRYLIQQVVRDGRTAAGGAELVCRLEHRRVAGRREVRQVEPFAGIIEQLAVEQSGPVRAVIRLAGRYRGEQSGRLWLPFVVRLVFYAGCDTAELVHSFVFDGDAERDFIAGLGLSVHVPLNEGVHNRHVCVVGERAAGAWFEPVRYLALGHPELAAAQLRGQAVAAPPDAGMLPAWADVQLLQDSCDHAVLRKRQGPDRCWVTADHAGRCPGVMSVSEPAGGLAVAVRDFWQAFPTCVEVAGADGTETHLRAWWWAPDAEPMDLRHYGRRDHRNVYEAVNADPAVYSSPFGVARTSQLTLAALGAGAAPERLLARAPQLVRPPLLAAGPDHHARCEVFSFFAPVDRSTPARAAVEDALARDVDFYLRQQDQRRWYGFWNYGDFMHTYDELRHCWRYDVGGCAWQNTELAADQWPWYAFLRNGRADVFRFCEAMTRHVAEVDVFHAGPWTAQGSRHNVVHWGCPCKEPRASQAAAKRFYHFLTADERCRDLLDEVAELADRFKATNVPTGGRVMARIGPTWAAWMANWLCAWERTGERRWLEKVLAGIEGILASPHRLLTPNPFDYDGDSGRMTFSDDYWLGHGLVATMGGAETWMEFVRLVDHPAFAAALEEYARLHALPPERYAAEVGADDNLKIRLRWGHARLAAWAAARSGEAELARRAWRMLLDGDGFPDGDTYERRAVPRDAPSDLVAAPRQEGRIKTNHAAMFGLNAVACLALAPRQLDEVWQAGHAAAPGLA